MKKIMLDQMILTDCCPTNAGSKMLDGYTGLFNATVVEKLKDAGYEIAGKLPVGEFAIDLVGETCFAGADNASAAAKALENDTVMAQIAFDVNGAPRRVAAQNGLAFVKPTYGTVSRFGTIPVACSGECVGVMARSVADCREVLSTIVGKDERDGTMHADEICKSAVANATPVKKVAVLKIPTDTADKIEAAKARFSANGIEICEIDAGVITAAKSAWNMLMCAELCNNVSRYDGVKYGYRTDEPMSYDELIRKSRSEGFGEEVKRRILLGTYALSSGYYDAYYKKALAVRQELKKEHEEIFAKCDCMLTPSAPSVAYGTNENIDDPVKMYLADVLTVTANIAGIPAISTPCGYDKCGMPIGFSLSAKQFDDARLVSLADVFEQQFAKKMPTL